MVRRTNFFEKQLDGLNHSSEGVVTTNKGKNSHHISKYEYRYLNSANNRTTAPQMLFIQFSLRKFLKGIY